MHSGRFNACLGPACRRAVIKNSARVYCDFKGGSVGHFLPPPYMVYFFFLGKRFCIATMHMLSMFCSNVFQRLLWESAPLDVWSTPRRPGGAVGPREAGRAGASARLHWLEDRGAARSGGAGKAPRVDALQTLQSLAGVWIVAPKFRRPDETVSLPYTAPTCRARRRLYYAHKPYNHGHFAQNESIRSDAEGLRVRGAFLEADGRGVKFCTGCVCNC